MSGRKQPTTETVNAADAAARWSALLDKVAKHDTRVVVEAGGVSAAAVISSDDLTRLEQFEAAREADFKVVDEIRAAFKDVPDEELEQEVNRAFWEARERRRAFPAH